MDQPDTSNVQPTYNQSYDEFVTRIMANMITSKPLDRELLARFAREVDGPTCDLGCGIGDVTRYLYQLGTSIYGIDPSSRNIALARQASPDIEFRLGDIITLDIEDNSLGGVVDFYSTLNRLSSQNAVSTLHEICRVLQPRGLLLLAFHQGQNINPADWWGYSDLIDGFFFERDVMEGDLQDSGFDIEESIARPPYPEIEVQTERVYIFARKRRSPKLTHIETGYTQCSVPASLQTASLSLVLHLLHRRHFPQNLRYAMFIVPMPQDSWRHWHLGLVRFHTPGRQRPDPKA
ncbi:class I SAM-dependent methyltransferase [Ktedonospora formicarum]|uniref:Methyltransferase domain-containing protein n=1 Tax=Ktedonospora formicarum TaxID=2778364 RepID=A0A8J3I7B9_9CHLR|nr:class I SAM-dependent methyltransferase [Ktedonospora formicarum]GHO48443.1 hypothetical protein KSX_66060 [Ktedonospora formicarum]